MSLYDWPSMAIYSCHQGECLNVAINDILKCVLTYCCFGRVNITQEILKFLLDWDNKDIIICCTTGTGGQTNFD